MVKVLSIYTIHCVEQAVSGAFLSLCKQPPDSPLQMTMVVPSCAASCRAPDLIEAIPSSLQWLYYRIGDPREVTEKRFLRELKKFDAAYPWPGTTLNTLQQVKAMEKPLIIERINCFTGTAKRILDDAYARMGLEPQHLNTPEVVQEETAMANLADFIMCPSPMVKQSFLEIGIPEQKLILTSYGWGSKRFPKASLVAPPKQPEDPITFLFVGTVCVRKGAHLILRAFARAGINGKLILRGAMEPAIAESCKDILSRPDVTHIEYSPNISSAYYEADVFVFPSLEEGGPQVTYEAMAHGLPVVVTPMGAGSVARDGVDGFVVQPYEEDALVEALQALAASPELRSQFGEAARQRAQEFTWEKVAASRANLMLEKLTQQPTEKTTSNPKKNQAASLASS